MMGWSRRLRWAAFVLGFVSATMAWAEEGGGLSSAPALPPDIHTVESLGRWTDKASSGYYRIVLIQGGLDVPVVRVWVQWIADKDGVVPEVQASVEVERFSGLAGATGQHFSWRILRHNCLEVVQNTRTPDGRKHRMRVVVTTPGHLESRCKIP